MHKNFGISDYIKDTRMSSNIGYADLTHLSAFQKWQNLGIVLYFGFLNHIPQHKCIDERPMQCE